MITRALEDYKMITSRSNQAAPAASDFASERSEAKSRGNGQADREASDFASERSEAKSRGNGQADRGASDFASERSGAKSLGEGRADREASDFASERFGAEAEVASGLVLRGFGFRLGAVRGKVGVRWGS